MKNWPHFALVACLAAFATPASVAGPASYQCQVLEQLSLGNDGALRRPPKPTLINARFAVDRQTGKFTGPERSLWSYIDSDHQVLAHGNQDNAFRAVATTRAAKVGLHVTMIEVQEHFKGARKPFVVTSGFEVFSGLCD